MFRRIVCLGLLVCVGAVLWLQTAKSAEVTVFSQTDWIGGSGQIGWSDATKFSFSVSVNSSVAGQVSLATNSWYDSAWSYRKKVTFDNLAQAENLTNFPVLVKLDPTRISYINTQDSGQDIRFSDSNGTTLLPYEIEKWDETGESFVWVKVPQIDAFSNTDFIYMYYGNTTATDAQDSTAVWDENYIIVQHLNETLGTHSDSTINGHDSTTVNLTQQGTYDGSIDGSDFFNGTTDDVRFNTFPRITKNFTIEFWLKPVDHGDNPYSMYVNQGRDWPCSGWQFNDNPSNPGYIGLWYDVDGDNNCDPWTAFPHRGEDVWQYITWTYEENGFSRVYVDSTTEMEIPYGGEIMYKYNEKLTLGESSISSNAYNAKGGIDELRISNSVRSENWVAAQYASMSDAFSTYGPVEGPYQTQGVLVSSVFDTGQSSNWGNVDWTLGGTGSADVKVRTSNNDDMSGATDFALCNTVTQNTDISMNNCVTGGQRYVQYQVTLTTSDPNTTPIFNDISIGYSNAISPTGSIVVNSGSTYTNSTSVALILTSLDDVDVLSSLEMMISNLSDFTGSNWEAFSATRNWSLALGEGLKTVYVKYKDSSGNESLVYSDSIILDTTKSTGAVVIEGGASHINKHDARLTLTITDVNSSGTQMLVSENSTFVGASWEVFTSSKTVTLSAGDGTKTVYVKYKDDAGNESEVYSSSIVVDTVIPTLIPLKLNTLLFRPNVYAFYYTTGKNLAISGTTEPLATVTITVYSDPITCATTADASGNFSCTFGTEIPKGNHTINISATDQAGNSVNYRELTLGIVVGLAATGSPAIATTPIGLVLLGLTMSLRKRRQQI